ncbi:MAG: right-handed parallel beta-helix repeat-containing protein [Pirellulaceae bacterium]
MDRRTAIQTLTMRLPQMNAARLRMLPLAVALAAFAVLAALKEIGGVPKPLVITLALCFLVCLPVLGILHRRKELSAVGYTTRLLVMWFVVSAALSGSVYQLDRGGWIWYRLSGYNQAIAEQRQEDVHLSPAEFVARNPFFRIEKGDGTRILLRKGDYVISRTVVVPKGTVLTIEPGTILQMRVGCSLIAYSPIIARGTQNAPILFTAQHRWFKWGAIGLVGTGQAIFEHVHLEHARQAVVNGIDFPGGLSLIDTDVEIKHCQFTNMFGKDAIYVRHGHVLMQDNRIQTAFKDGVDLDGSS